VLLTNLVFVTEGAADHHAEADAVTSGDRLFAKDGAIVMEANYPVVETARQMLKLQGAVGVNRFQHARRLTSTDAQPVVRMNRDTYYSTALVNVSGGAMLTLPVVPAGRYLSVQPITEDHRIQPMSYGGGTYPLATHTGTHLFVIVRLDSAFTPQEAALYQDQMEINAGSSGRFSFHGVDEHSFVAVERGLKAKVGMLARRDGVNALKGMFTAPTDSSRGLFTEEKYQIGAAIGWGGAQWVDNIYEVSPNFPVEDCHQLTFEDPGNEAFWSVTVYDQSGFMFDDLASVSSTSAAPNEDGTYTLSFGCGALASNNIGTANESGVFNVAIRHYRPGVKVREEGYRLLPRLRVVE
jgi:hypothetical protein